MKNKYFKFLEKKWEYLSGFQGKEGVLKQDTKAQTIKKRTNKFYKKNLCITRERNKLQRQDRKGTRHSIWN